MTVQPDMSVPTEAEIPRVSFVIPVRNDAEGLARCLASIAASQYPRDRWEVVVADNGSVDDSAAVARAAGALVVDLPGLSVAALRNHAARLAAGNLLAFVDADHEITPSWLASAATTLADPSVGAAGAPCHVPAEATWVQRVYDTLRDHTPGRRDVSWLGSGNLVVRRSCFEEAGGFDESLVTCEDVDLCSRLRAKKLRVRCDSTLVSIHYGDPRTLRDLFMGELWRGQDNLRVSLRHRMSARDLPGILMPLVFLASLSLLAVGLPLLLLGEPRLLISGVVGLVATIASRAVKMTANAGMASVRNVPATLLVAATYELARGLALLVRTSHRRAEPAHATL